MWRATARALEAPRGIRWYARPSPIDALHDPVVDEAEVAVAVLGQERVGLEGVDRVAEEEVGDLAGVAPGLVDPQPARVVLEQQRRGARLLDLLVDRLAVARLQPVGEPLELAVEHQAAARLEDVGAQAEHARVVEERGLAAAGVRDDLDLRPGASLERPRAEQRERSFAVVEQRRAAAQQGPVEIEVGGAEHASSLTSVVVVRDIEPWDELLEAGRTDERLVTQSAVNAKPGRESPIPDELHGEVADALRARGIERLWSHQAEAIHAAWAGPTIVTTGTASGKSMCFQLPTLDVLARDARARALYLYPTKALAQDQARALNALGVDRARPAIYDGDTPREQRSAIRRNANVVLTNPDMLHLGILPNHPAWANFLSNLAIVVVDEAHVYRGVFGSHVGNVLRRLRRVAGAYGTEPRILMASATIGNPGELAERLTGLEDFTVIERDGSPVTKRTIAMWNPPITDEKLGTRRSVLSEAADLLAELDVQGARTIVFMKSRKAVELMAKFTQLALEDLGHPKLAERIAPYRAGYTPQQRRELERRLVEGELLGVVSTDALELGIDIGSLDAAICVTFPGTVASLRQQWGRAGRRGRGLAVYIAGEDALDQFFCRHPDEFLDRPVENAILDHENEQIHAAHILCAAHEGPLVAERRRVPRPPLEGDRRAAGERRPPARAPGRPVRAAAPRRVPRRRASRCARPAATAS